MALDVVDREPRGIVRERKDKASAWTEDTGGLPGRRRRQQTVAERDVKPLQIIDKILAIMCQKSENVTVQEGGSQGGRVTL
jgi:hypothetical protein